jgi:Lrp/AsnC family transcriptional regulator for asnA, asnC and gidA
MTKSTLHYYDFLDYRIIQELHANARTPAADIARKVGANERTIRKRINRLLKFGLIRLTAIVNPEALNYTFSVDIFLETQPEIESTIINKLLSMQEITYLAFGQGKMGISDISIEARFKDIEEMRRFLNHNLASMPDLKVNSYALVPKILKNLDDWLPKKEDFVLEFEE